MPRKPTLLAREAKAILLKRVETLTKDIPLPTLGELAGELNVHPSTVFRILRDMVTEGLVWQSPTGKFYAASAQRNALRGAPICFVGREVWQWSRLYHEVLEGISEVCAANESPLVALSSRLLVRQITPTDPPVFAKKKAQCEEIARLLPMIPKGCAGIILDHVWAESVIKAQRWPGGSRLQLFSPGSPSCPGIGPSHEAASSMVADYLRKKLFRRVALVVPFEGDPSIDAATANLRRVLSEFNITEISYPDFVTSPAKLKSLLAKHEVVICPEDNVALAIADLLPPASQLIGIQGTGVLHAPHARLRYDFRRLGRAAASNILHGTKAPVISPTLISQQI
ncbi:MAG: hypothetical protein D4R65_14960 [Verrucomicrobiaceae bacterium]|nr:MAG: hypothetical protein D4R65_14960 [Verrucomicrobiaceae bacterium]